MVSLEDKGSVPPGTVEGPVRRRSSGAATFEGLADYLHDQALLAQSDAANRVGGTKNRLLAEAEDCRRWGAALPVLLDACRAVWADLIDIETDSHIGLEAGRALRAALTAAGDIR